MVASSVEFDRIYTFLRNELPRSFNSGAASEGAFGVSEEFDDDLVVSFLMTYDEFNLSVPKAIQNFLAGLSQEWTVFGSFQIASPFSPDGRVNPCPRFAVTRRAIQGDTDMAILKNRLGQELTASA